MSLQVIVEVRCDECGEESENGWQVGYMARDAARDDGWRVSLPGGEDLCPDCRASR